MTPEEAARIVRGHTPGRAMSLDAQAETFEAHLIDVDRVSPEDAAARAASYRAVLLSAQGSD
jgi:hypothetical protein